MRRRTGLPLTISEAYCLGGLWLILSGYFLALAPLRYGPDRRRLRLKRKQSKRETGFLRTNLTLLSLVAISHPCLMPTGRR